MIQGIIGGICVRLPLSWVFSRIEPVSFFRIGLATPMSTIVQIILCGIVFVYFRNNGSFGRKEKDISDIKR